MVDEVTSSGTGTDVVPGWQVQWADWLEGRHQTPKSASQVTQITLTLILHRNYEFKLCSICSLYLWMIEVGWICPKPASLK